MRIQFQKRLALALALTGGCLLSSLAHGQQHPTIHVTAEPMCCVGCGQKIADQFYTVPGVKSVSLDYSSKTLSVAFQPGRTPSPRLLCEAVLRTEDHPVKVTGPFGAISLEYPKATAAQAQDQPSHTTIVLQRMRSQAEANQIAAQLYALKSAKSINLDLQHNALYVTPHEGQQLALWLLWEAVERAGDHAIMIQGPTGTLKNDTLATAQRRSSQIAR